MKANKSNYRAIGFCSHIPLQASLRQLLCEMVTDNIWSRPQKVEGNRILYSASRGLHKVAATIREDDKLMQLLEDAMMPLEDDDFEGDGVRLMAVQRIVAPSGAEPQTLHRDISSEGLRMPFQTSTLIVSTNDTDIRTRIHPRSHLEIHRSRQHTRTRGTNELHQRETHVVVPGGTSTLYDSYIYHGGGAAPSTGRWL